MLGVLKKILSGVRGARVSPQEAVGYVNGGAVLVDVREKDEFARGHAHGAYNIPLRELRAGGTALLDARLPAGTREVVLVCQSGMRSRVAQSILSGQDARTYLDLAGGMGAWRGHGLPIARHD
ncbi:rhodanese-like domain-containing protein [Pseudoxanthomonas japonensis]|uniref:Sulfurtransferase n=1 Tax=Pseudoxanthomonas japonensis TaxID=69284 RepID=A0ABQ6ZE50_9GAMM|nr:rhodanese-like domain-containing protein [Pseudoxanthomonas japonensis]KAF1723652.1 sulfurtransferase [Pseudoxanthomonas japonensis]